MTDTWLRIVKPDRRGDQKNLGRMGVSRVEVIKDGVVIAKIPGLTYVLVEDPLDGASSLTLTTVYFEQQLEPREAFEGAARNGS